MKWIAVQDQETLKWSVIDLVPFAEERKWNKTYTRSKKIRVQRNWVIPKPEDVSCFIKAHKIIEAKTKEEALCHLQSI